MKTLESPIRILYVNGGTMDMGGISAYMMNYYRFIDKKRIQIDFIVHGKYGVYDREIETLGGKVYHIPTKRENYIQNRIQIRSILSSGQYKIVHSHMDGMNGNLLREAAKLHIPVRISHSHNTEFLTNNILKILFHKYYRSIIPKYATELWACSSMAGRWLYGQGHTFEVIPNAIDTDKYAFNTKLRDQIRGKLGLRGKYVIGHVGKISYQKNHAFLIKLFYEISQKKSDVVLMLVGDGDLRQKMEDLVEKYDIASKVIFMGQQDNVNELLNAMDVFVMPSIFEGLPVVLVEAQCNGLHCICSTNVPEESNITGNVEFITLSDNVNRWVTAIMSNNQRDYEAKKKVVSKGYDIVSASKILEKTYFELLEKA